MGMMEAVQLFFQNYVKFDGRSRRAEFWWPALMNLIIGWTLTGLSILVGGGFDAFSTLSLNAIGWLFYGASLLWSLAVLLPNIAVTVRRFHDRNMSGWFFLIFMIGMIIPLLNLIVAIVYIVIMALPGTAGSNKFGMDPKSGHDVSAFS
ncbi:MAG: DUF805 domain-containing protein [Pseudomonadota bacterium]